MDPISSENIFLIFNDTTKLINRTLLTTSSPVFAAVFTGNFVNSTTKTYVIEGYTQTAVLILLDCIQHEITPSELWNYHRYGTLSPKTKVDIWIEVFLIANEYVIPTLAEKIRMLLLHLRRHAIETNDVGFADHILETFVELDAENCLPGISLIDELIHQSSEVEKTHSVHFYFDVGDDCSVWRTEDAEYILLVEELNKAMGEKYEKVGPGGFVRAVREEVILGCFCGCAPGFEDSCACV